MSQNISKIIQLGSFDELILSEIMLEIIKSIGLDKIENNPDVMIIRQSEKQSIGIEEVSEALRWIYIRPFSNKVKVLFISNADNLTMEAQNSLLKITEEPPLFSHIFFIVENHKNLLETIISRSELIRKGQGSVNSDIKAEEFLAAEPIGKIKMVDLLSKYTSKELGIFIDSVIQIIYKQEASLDQLNLISKILNLKSMIKQNVNKKLLLTNLTVYLKDFTL